MTRLLVYTVYFIFSFWYGYLVGGLSIPMLWKYTVIVFPTFIVGMAISWWMVW